MWIEVLLAYMLDLLIGDPEWSIHPVRLMGKLIGKLELHLRKLVTTPFQERIAGTLLVFAVCILSFGAAYLLVAVARAVIPWLGLLISAIVIYCTLAIRDLEESAKAVAVALEAGQLEKARSYVARIVGRDSNDLAKEDIIRAAVESVAESTVDSIVAPIFYAFLGGAPLAFLYRAVNTMDSMLGYKNHEYINFGWAAAKLDDIFNFVPARINAILVPLASFIVGKNCTGAIVAALRDGNKHPSPNSGIAEAAFAGALGVQLGGESTYKSEQHCKPYLGRPLAPLKIGDIYSSLRISFACSALMIISSSLIYLIIGRLK